MCLRRFLALKLLYLVSIDRVGAIDARIETNFNTKLNGDGKFYNVDVCRFIYGCKRTA